MKLLRLRGRKVCERVSRKGFLWKGKTFHARWLPGVPRAEAHPQPALYSGTIASAKLDKSAVRRNRMRRRCREALRTAVQTVEPFGAVQLLILPRSSSLSAPFSAIQTDVETFLTHLHNARRTQAQ